MQTETWKSSATFEGILDATRQQQLLTGLARRQLPTKSSTTSRTALLSSHASPSPHQPGRRYAVYTVCTVRLAPFDVLLAIAALHGNVPLRTVRIANVWDLGKTKHGNSVLISNLSAGTSCTDWEQILNSENETQGVARVCIAVHVQSVYYSYAHYSIQVVSRSILVSAKSSAGVVFFLTFRSLYWKMVQFC